MDEEYYDTEEYNIEELNHKLWDAAIDRIYGDVLNAIEFGADVDCSDPESDESNLVNYLSKHRDDVSLEILKLLIDSGARLDILDHDKNSPLGTAFIYSNYEAAKMLLEANVDPDIMIGNEHATDYLARTNQIDLLNLIQNDPISKGVYLDDVDYS